MRATRWITKRPPSYATGSSPDGHPVAPERARFGHFICRCDCDASGGGKTAVQVFFFREGAITARACIFLSMTRTRRGKRLLPPSLPSFMPTSPRRLCCWSMLCPKTARYWRRLCRLRRGAACGFSRRMPGTRSALSRARAGMRKISCPHVGRKQGANAAVETAGGNLRFAGIAQADRGLRNSHISGALPSAR